MQLISALKCLNTLDTCSCGKNWNYCNTVINDVFLLTANSNTNDFIISEDFGYVIIEESLQTLERFVFI